MKYSKKILYDGFYHIRYDKSICWEPNAVFIGNGYHDYMIKTHPCNITKGDDSHYFNWKDEDHIWDFGDYGLWWSVNREDLENNLKESNNEI